MRSAGRGPSEGLARTFQQPELFMGLTVREHLVLAHRARVSRRDGCGATCSTREPLLPASAAENERVDGLLELLRLTRVAKARWPRCRSASSASSRWGGPWPPIHTSSCWTSRLSGLDMKASENLADGLPRDRRRKRPWALAHHGRARRGRRPVPVRHRLRARLRRAHRRRDARSRSATTPRCGPPTWATGRRSSALRSRHAGAAPDMTEPLLEVQDLDVRYGASQALFGVSVDGRHRDGAGRAWGPTARARAPWPARSRAWCRRRAGRVRFDGRDDHRAPGPPHPQARPDLHPRGPRHLPGPLRDRQPAHGGRPGEAARPAGRHRPRPSSASPCSGDRRRQRAGSLSGGEQQMLALARALAVSPKLIIADEMSLGLAPLVAESVFQGLEEARRSGITIVLTEQFVHRALSHGGQLRDPDPGAGGLVRSGLARPGKRSSTATWARPRPATPVGVSERVTVTTLARFVPTSRYRRVAYPLRGPGPGPGEATPKCKDELSSRGAARTGASRAVLTAAVAGLPLAAHRRRRRHRRRPPGRRSPSPTSPTSPVRAGPRTPRRRPASRPASTCRTPRAACNGHKLVPLVIDDQTNPSQIATAVQRPSPRPSASSRRAR